MTEIPGIEKFKGRQIHSHIYRSPEDFQGERVVLLGGGVSGIDISLEVSRNAKEVSVDFNWNLFSYYCVFDVSKMLCQIF